MPAPSDLLDAFEHHQSLSSRVLALETALSPSMDQRHQLFDLHAQKTKASEGCLAAWDVYSKQLQSQALEEAGSEREELVKLVKQNVKDSAVLSRHQITLFSLVAERAPHLPGPHLQDAARQLEAVAGEVTAAVQGREGEAFVATGLTTALVPLLGEIRKDGTDPRRGQQVVQEAAAVTSMWINRAHKTMEVDSVLAQQQLDRLGKKKHVEALRELPLGLQHLIASVEMKVSVSDWRAQRHPGISEVLTDRIVASAPKPRN